MPDDGKRPFGPRWQAAHTGFHNFRQKSGRIRCRSLGQRRSVKERAPYAGALSLHRLVGVDLTLEKVFGPVQKNGR